MGLNAFPIVGGATTVRFAVLLAVPAIGVWFVVTPDVVFGSTPAVLLVTEKLTLHEPFAGMMIPLKLKAVAPATRLPGVVPVHVPTTSPPAALIFTSVSVNAPPVNCVPLELLNVSVTVDVPPVWIEVGVNNLAIVGGAKTVRLAVLLAAPAAGVCVVVTPDVVFGWTPAVLLVTLKTTVQELLAGIVIPLKLKAVAFAANVFGVVPTQVPVTLPPTALIFASVSVKAPLVKFVALTLLNVNVTVLVPPVWIDVGLNALAIVGGVNTNRFAVLLALPATGVCVVVTPEVVFGFVPGVLLVTLKMTVHEPLPGMVIPLKLNAVVPATNTFGVVPTHVPVTAPPDALMFASVSVKAPPVRLPAFGLVSVSVTTLVPPGEIEVGLNALAIVGGATTVRLAVLLAAPATGVCVVATPDVVFGWTPAVLLVTLKITVQELLAGMVIPLKLNAVAFAARLFGVVPAHVPVTAPPTAAIFTSVSVNAPLVRADPFELLRVKVTVLVPPVWIEVGENAFAIVGCAKTVRLAVLLAAPAIPVSTVVTPDVAFGFVPSVLLFTLKMTVQELLAGIVMPVKLRAVALAASEFGVVPAHVPVTEPPAALMLVSVSVKAPPVNADAFELLSVNVTTLVPPVRIDVGLNAFAIVGVAIIVVGSLDESSDVSSSPPPETVAVFVTASGAFDATVTGTVIAGKLAAAAIAAVLVHETTCRVVVHVQPPPVAAPGVSPAGKVSVIVVVPLVAAGPSLLGVTV